MWEYKSYSRYFYPLPLQRSLYNLEARNYDIYKTSLREFESYDGDYIILQNNWFDINQNKKIKNKLLNDYHVIYSIQSAINKNYSYILFKKNQ